MRNILSAPIEGSAINGLLTYVSGDIPNVISCDDWQTAAWPETYVVTINGNAYTLHFGAGVYPFYGALSQAPYISLALVQSRGTLMWDLSYDEGMFPGDGHLQANFYIVPDKASPIGRYTKRKFEIVDNSFALVECTDPAVHPLAGDIAISVAAAV